VTPYPLGAVAMCAESRWLTKKDIKHLTSLGSSTIDRLEAEGKFPKRERPTEGRAIWIEEKILEWMRDRIGSKEPLVCEIEKAKNKARREAREAEAKLEAETFTKAA
jgi:predicted DNA-binding transcriptional regulator AlpA